MHSWSRALTLACVLALACNRPPASGDSSGAESSVDGDSGDVGSTGENSGEASSATSETSASTETTSEGVYIGGTYEIPYLCP